MFVNQEHKPKIDINNRNINTPKPKKKNTSSKKNIKLPVNTISLPPLHTKSPKNYSPFLLRIGKGKISPQRAEEVEKHS